MSCTPKQIDLQAFFVATAALLCQYVIIIKINFKFKKGVGIAIKSKETSS